MSITRCLPGLDQRLGDAPTFRGPGLRRTNGTTFVPSGTGSRSQTLAVRYRRNILPSWPSVSVVVAMIAAASSLRLVFSPAASAWASKSSRRMSTGSGQATAACLCGQSLTSASAASGVSLMGLPHVVIVG